ncbi:hypothetical protein RclHR1_09290002 [Rhizophagus clarus]|uniref:Teneurin-4 isoform X11 n=1 Tax=Rhizophagus clarus TaxID=94130 RepID=A0A2Z6SQA2_9GLOM|nr:hypothetical protein RclHR1_09290002 [Rhizophagus clarus]GES79105.1 teneurin-4 isoform X11 [Rhizophagus clarus]
MSESKEEEDNNKSSKLNTKDDEDLRNSPVFTSTVTPPPTVLKKLPTPSSDNFKTRGQTSSTITPIHQYYIGEYYTGNKDYKITPHMRIDDDQRIPIVDISDDEKDDRVVKIKNRRRYGPSIIWEINAWCNFVMLFGCGALLFFYFKSSIQSDYVQMAKIFIIIFLILELIVRIINLLQMKYYDYNFGLGDCLGILLIKKESYLIFSSKWIELSQVIKLADTADDTCFIIPALFLLHIILYFLIRREDPKDTSYVNDNICHYMEIILSFPATILVITRIWFIIKTIDYAKKVDDDDDDHNDCCNNCGNGDDWDCSCYCYWYGNNQYRGEDCDSSGNCCDVLCNDCENCCGACCNGCVNCCDAFCNGYGNCCDAFCNGCVNCCEVFCSGCGNCLGDCCEASCDICGHCCDGGCDCGDCGDCGDCCDCGDCIIC